MMRALFGDAVPLAPQRHSVVRIGAAEVTVGEAPEYVQARDVFTREFWITGIRHVLERIFLVTSSSPAEEIPDPDVVKGILDQDDAKIMDPEAKKILDPATNAKKILDPATNKASNSEPNELVSDNSAANGDVMTAAQNDDVMAVVQRQVDEAMAEIRTRDWTDDELQALFWILHELIESGGIQINGGKITINGEDYYIRDIISQCCPIG
jgi:hypothetical protein